MRSFQDMLMIAAVFVALSTLIRGRLRAKGRETTMVYPLALFGWFVCNSLYMVVAPFH